MSQCIFHFSRAWLKMQNTILFQQSRTAFMVQVHQICIGWILHRVFLECWFVLNCFENFWPSRYSVFYNFKLTMYFFALAQLGWHCCLCRYSGLVTISILRNFRFESLHRCPGPEGILLSFRSAFLNQSTISRISKKLAEPMQLWQGLCSS